MTTSQDIIEKILRMKYDPDKVKRKSYHYMGYIAEHPCVVTRLCGIPQEGRTTVEHIDSGMMGKRAPDFWTVPLSYSIHLSGDISLETIGKEGVKEHFNLPPWEDLALLYLVEYLGRRHYLESNTEDPKASDYHSAVYWAQQLIEHYSLGTASTALS